MARSFPASGDAERAKLIELLRLDVGVDQYCFNARYEAGDLLISFPASILSGTKPIAMNKS